MSARTWLNPGEDIVVDVRPHWSFLGRPLIAVVVVLAGAIVAVTRHASRALDDVLAVLVVLSLLWLVGRYARWATTAMILTNERLVQRRGVLSRRVRELPLAQIGEVDCRRRVFEHLPRPNGIVKELHRQIDLAGRARWGGADSVAEQLGKLEDLRRRGSISQVEFDEHRERLLGPW